MLTTQDNLRAYGERRVKSATAEEMREMDRRAIEEYGIAAVVLMENAGAFTALAAAEMLPSTERKPIMVVCGTGNNGGDGMVAARHLINQGREVRIFLVGNAEKMRGEALINLNILRKMEVEPKEIREEKDITSFKKELDEAGLIVDAIFGTGLSGEVREPVKRLLELLNQSGVPVLAVDIPSGLHADTGEILGAAVCARATVTFGLAKKGFFQNQGPRCVGEIRVCDIGMPRQVLQGSS